MRINKLFLFLFCLLLTRCKPEISKPTVNGGRADFTRVVALGDDFFAGYQDDALYNEAQHYSIPNLIAGQIKLVTQFNFNQPTITNEVGINSKPWEGIYTTKSRLGFKTDCNGVTDFFPLKNTINQSAAVGGMQSFINGTIQNLAIPFCKSVDVNDPAFGNVNGNFYYSHFTSAQGSSTLLRDAAMQNPTFVLLWLGMEDIFSFSQKGGKDVSITPVSVFESQLDSVLKTLTSNQAKGVIATIPDLESFPFYTLISSRGLMLSIAQADSLNQLTGLQLYNQGENGFFIEYPKNSGNYRQMGRGENVLLDIPIDSLKCYSMGLVFPISDRYTLDSTEISSIHQSIATYNSVIKQKALQYDFAFTDMNQFFKNVKSGIIWDGVTLNADFISGGIFSLDGYHPHQKGYSIIANEFIKSINNYYGATLPWVNCKECNGVKFP